MADTSKVAATHLVVDIRNNFTEFFYDDDYLSIIQSDF